MKLYIVAVRDSKANAFGVPFFQPNLGGAIRQFNDECKRAAPDNVMYKHSADFELFHLGSYDDEFATFTLLDRPTSIALGSECQPEGKYPAPVNPVPRDVTMRVGSNGLERSEN